MFFVRFDDGMTETEEKLKKWDNVPRDRKIKTIGVAIPIQVGDKRRMFPIAPLPEGCEKYCCTKLARKIVVGNGVSGVFGYALMGIKGGYLYRIEITHRGFGPLKIFYANESKIAEGAWRDGC